MAVVAIKNLSKLNIKLDLGKNDHGKYWIESTYKYSSGKMNRCYEITKQGCEFLTHKTTGTKGNLFTHHYMERF